jgi:hypothetical protein
MDWRVGDRVMEKVGDSHPMQITEVKESRVTVRHEILKLTRSYETDELVPYRPQGPMTVSF